MTILFARSGYSPTGGAERYLQRLAGALQKLGHEVILLANPAWPEDKWPVGTIRRIDGTTPEDFAAEVAMVRDDYPGAILFAGAQIPCADVYRAAGGVHASWLDRQTAEESRLASWFRRRRPMHRQILELERQQYTGNPDIHIIAISQMVGGEIVSYYDFPRERITVIPCGYTPGPQDPGTRREAREQVRRQHGIPDDAPLVLFLGSGWKRKGADILAEAFRQLAHPTAHLILAGRGKLRRATPPRVHTPGPVSNPEDYLLASDLFALPTLYDPFANACLEAIAYGLPVLVTESAGFAETLGQFPKAGEAIPLPRSIAAWRDALARWLEPDKLEAARDDLAGLAAAYTLEDNVRQTVALLEKLQPRQR